MPKRGLHLRNMSLRAQPARTTHAALEQLSGKSKDGGIGNDVDERRKLYGTVTRPRTGALGGLGQTYKSVEAVTQCLEHNHLYHDTFFNDKGFHNHTAHHLLAEFSLGAGPSAIYATYESSLQGHVRPMPELKTEITDDNWTEFLGKDEYYSSYLAFFNRAIQQLGSAATIEKYVFSGDGGMLDRFVSGAIHPFIHTGHGVEFGVDALTAEGLAQCAVHSRQTTRLFGDQRPPYSQRAASRGSPHASFADTVASLPRDRHVTTAGKSGFAILQAILADPELAPGVANDKDSFPALGETLKRRGDKIREYCEQWQFAKDVPDWHEVVSKAEELFWMATVIYGAATRPGYKPKLDFFTMHALTSVLFVPSYLEALSPHNWAPLLHSHWRVLVGYWIARGRPRLYITEYLLRATETPSPPPPTTTTRAGDSDKSAGTTTTLEATGLAREISKRGLKYISPEASGPTALNPWSVVVQAAIDHPDEHVTKVIRSLVFAATHFGRTPKGFFGDSQLPGADQLDGTIFIRAAGMTLDAMGWTHFGQDPAEDWDRSKPGYDDAWTDAPKL